MPSFARSVQAEKHDARCVRDPWFGRSLMIATGTVMFTCRRSLAKLIRQVDVLQDNIWRCLLRACHRDFEGREQGVEIPCFARSLHHDRGHFHDTSKLETETACTSTSIQYRQAASVFREFLRPLDFQEDRLGPHFWYLCAARKSTLSGR